MRTIRIGIVCLIVGLLVITSLPMVSSIDMPNDVINGIYENSRGFGNIHLFSYNGNGSVRIPIKIPIDYNTGMGNMIIAPFYFAHFSNDNPDECAANYAKGRFLLESPGISWRTIIEREYQNRITVFGFGFIGIHQRIEVDDIVVGYFNGRAIVFGT